MSLFVKTGNAARNIKTLEKSGKSRKHNNEVSYKLRASAMYSPTHRSFSTSRLKTKKLFTYKNKVAKLNNYYKQV
jgi:hypothetical protein